MTKELFRVDVITKTPNPQLTAYLAAHNDYSEIYIFDEAHAKWPTEKRAGELLIKNVLSHRHMGPLEHPQIVFGLGYINHATLMQLRTHRTGISFDIQSSRYSGKRIVECANGKQEVDKVFYIRQPGVYIDREGRNYTWTEEQRNEDLRFCLKSAQLYAKRIDQGVAPEQARSVIVHDLRQNCVMSANFRTMWHLFSLRFPKDAQHEIRILMELLYPHMQEWAPQLMEFHEKKMKYKSLLAP